MVLGHSAPKMGMCGNAGPPHQQEVYNSLTHEESRQVKQAPSQTLAPPHRTRYKKVPKSYTLIRYKKVAKSFTLIRHKKVAKSYTLIRYEKVPKFFSGIQDSRDRNPNSFTVGELLWTCLELSMLPGLCPIMGRQPFWVFHTQKSLIDRRVTTRPKVSRGPVYHLTHRARPRQGIHPASP